MSLIFRAEPSSTPTFGGNAMIYPSFTWYDQIGKTFWAIWLKEIEQVCGNVNSTCFLNIWQFVQYPHCRELSHMKVPWRILWKILSDSASTENMSYVGMPSHFLRLQTLFPRLRLSLATKRGDKVLVLVLGAKQILQSSDDHMCVDVHRTSYLNRASVVLKMSALPARTTVKLCDQ